MSARRFLVSGGSGGIGAATCDALAAAGYLPVVGYHQGRAAAEAVARRTGGWPLALDLTSEASIDAALDALSAQEFGQEFGQEPGQEFGQERGPDTSLAGALLAGSPPLVLAPFGRIAAEDLQRQWQIHVLGPQRLLAGLVRRCWRAQKDGVVIGVLSQAMGDGERPAAPGLGAYVIAKYGLAGLLAVLAADYPWLRVRSVQPGYTETRLLEAFDERFLAQQRARTPFQTPQEVAAQILAIVAEVPQS